MRDKVESRYSTYITSSEKDALLSGLSSAEDWLYSEEGEDATKSAYVAKLDNLKSMGDPVVLRFKESEDRPKAAAGLRESADLFLGQAQGGDEKFSHIEEADRNKVVSCFCCKIRVPADLRFSPRLPLLTFSQTCTSLLHTRSSLLLL
jgi:heat shock protein 4